MKTNSTYDRSNLQIQYIKIELLINNKKNSRLHSKEQLSQIEKSIKEFGFLKPLLVDENNILIAGHGALQAAKNLKMKQVPCLKIEHLSDEQKRALLIADNKIPMNAAWDMDVLKMELKDLSELGFNMDVLAFSDSEILEIYGDEDFANNQRDDEGESRVVSGQAVSTLGDVWELGKLGHRLMCGSSTIEADVKKLMNDNLASMVFTDPPYGVSYKSDNFDMLANDDLANDDLINKLLLPAFKNIAKFSENNAGIYIWHPSMTREDFKYAMKIAGLQERQYIAWVKNQFVMGRSDYHEQLEYCFYCCKRNFKSQFYGDRKNATVWHVQHKQKNELSLAINNGVLLLDGEGDSLYLKSKPPNNVKYEKVRVGRGDLVSLFSSGTTNTTAWEIARDSSNSYIHPTQKPVALAIKAINNSSQPGEIVLDLFAGSGSTLIGAERTGRKCYTMELEPCYVDAIIQRYQETTGQKVFLVNNKDNTTSKKTFEEVKAERYVT